MRWRVCLLACLGLAVSVPSAGWAGIVALPGAEAAGAAGENPNVTLISDVPAYIWHHGCGPTAAGMILGYWDAHGFGNLIPGSNDWQANQQAVKDMMASPGHVADYALYDGVDDSDPGQWPHAYPYPDRSEIDPEGAHTADCLADFMRCSWSSEGLKHGYSFREMQSTGMVCYTLLRGHFANAYDYAYAGLWQVFTSAIDAGYPVQLLVDSNGDGQRDHFVTGIGYDDTPGEQKYACHNTWDQDVHWFDFASVANGQPWGIYAATFYEPFPEPACLTPLTLTVFVFLRRRGRRR